MNRRAYSVGVAKVREFRRKDTIIMSLTQCVPKLNLASSEDPGSYDGLLRSSGVVADEKTFVASQADLERLWWRRVFGA